MVKKECFLEAGGFSQDVEDRLKDVDLCLKLETLGFHLIFTNPVYFWWNRITGPEKRKAAVLLRSLKKSGKICCWSRTGFITVICLWRARITGSGRQSEERSAHVGRDSCDPQF